MDKKNCANCKYWYCGDDEYDVYGAEFGARTCAKTTMFHKSTEWNEKGNGLRRTKEAKDSLAFVQDGSDYYAVLITMPDFYCNQWQMHEKLV